MRSNLIQLLTSRPISGDTSIQDANLAVAQAQSFLPSTSGRMLGMIDVIGNWSAQNPGPLKNQEFINSFNSLFGKQIHHNPFLRDLDGYNGYSFNPDNVFGFGFPSGAGHQHQHQHCATDTSVFPDTALGILAYPSLNGSGGVFEFNSYPPPASLRLNITG